MRRLERIYVNSFDEITDEADFWKRAVSRSELDMIEALKEVKWATILSPLEQKVLQAVVYGNKSVSETARAVKQPVARVRKALAAIKEKVFDSLKKMEAI